LIEGRVQSSFTVTMLNFILIYHHLVS